MRRAEPPCVASWSVMRCHDLHSETAKASREVQEAVSRRDDRFPDLARRRGGSGRRACAAAGRLLRTLRSSPSCMSVLHPVSFHSLPFSPPPCPCGGTLIRAYPARAPAPGGARFAAARFARLIARMRLRARAGRRAHLARCLNRGLFRAGANGETKRTRGCRFLLPAQSSGCLENFNPFVELFL